MAIREHSIEVRVRYAETDQMQVVYHANYLITHADNGARLVSAATTLAAITHEGRLTTLPNHLRELLTNAST